MASPARAPRLARAARGLLAFVAMLVASAAVAASPRQAPGAASGTVIYRGVTVISAEAATARADMAIIIDDDRIRAVVPDGSLRAGDLRGATIHAAHGLYALPGLVDSHVHYATSPHRRYAEAELRRDIYAGITAVRDMAGDARALADLARAAQAHEIPAPDVYYSALVAGRSFYADPRTHSAALGLAPGSAPWLQAIDEDTNLELAVALARGTSATGLKIYANLSGDRVRALIAEAHRQHFPVWTHSQVYPATPYDSLGATAVSHVCMIARYVLEPGKAAYGHADEPVYDAVRADDPQIMRYVAALADAGTVMDATVSVYPLAKDRQGGAGRARGCSRELAGAIAGEMFRAGVALSTGTDHGAPPRDPFPPLEGELGDLVRYAGLSPFDAIVASTRNGARVLGLDADFGTLEPGKLANIVFVRRNPLDDIANLKSVVLTVKRGVRYPRSDYRPTYVAEPRD